MKLRDLQEIFEPAMSSIDMDRPHRFDNLPKDPNMGRELGRGTFSKASDDESDPHMITKSQMAKHSNSFLTDLFDDYAKIITDEKLWNMIHFPRVYATKKYTDPQGDIKHRWSMERLLPMDHDSIGTRDLQSLSERYFNEQSYTEIADTDFHISEIANELGAIIEEEAWHLIKDPTLRKASMKLKEIYERLSDKDRRATFDLHEENIMFRRSHTGLDIIFSDPFVSV